MDFLKDTFLKNCLLNMKDKIQIILQAAWLSSFLSIINANYTQLKNINFIMFLNKTDVF